MSFIIPFCHSPCMPTLQASTIPFPVIVSFFSIHSLRIWISIHAVHHFPENSSGKWFHQISFDRSDCDLSSLVLILYGKWKFQVIWPKSFSKPKQRQDFICTFQTDVKKEYLMATMFSRSWLHLIIGSGLFFSNFTPTSHKRLLDFRDDGGALHIFKCCRTPELVYPLFSCYRRTLEQNSYPVITQFQIVYLLDWILTLWGWDVFFVQKIIMNCLNSLQNHEETFHGSTAERHFSPQTFPTTNADAYWHAHIIIGPISWIFTCTFCKGHVPIQAWRIDPRRTLALIYEPQAWFANCEIWIIAFQCKSELIPVWID